MAYEPPGALALDDAPCRYGAARVNFRGPPARLDGAYVAALGGAETFGKAVADPWPAQLGRRLGLPVANLGCAHAGPDLYLGEPDLVGIAARARLRILQVPGAMTVSNPFYTVHPRRNDRFVSASDRLRSLYPDVDFTEVHFTRHLVLTLFRRGPERFGPVAEALREAWLTRMGELLSAIGGPTVLLWIGTAPPPRHASPWGAPALVDASMIEVLRPRVAEVIEVMTPDAGVDIGGPHAHEALARRIAALAARHL
jgi:hypothetical protein